MNGAVNKVVSYDSEELILVDADDNEIGSMNKAHAHDGDGVLHRAFSLFVFNAHGELLLQRRSADKRLWPMYWSNSCCSHPRLGEDLQTATERRLDEELGVRAELEFVYKFSYQVRYDDSASENELCSVFLGRCDDSLQPNGSEIAEARFVNAGDLRAELEQQPQSFTPWFRMEWERLQTEFATQLRKYAG